jgi:phosphatidylglycerol lysyltransferase
VVLLGAVAAYLLLAGLRRSPIRIGRRELRLPTGSLAAQQLSVSCLDWVFSSGALYVLLAGVTPVPYLTFLATFLGAQLAVLLLPIPGGIGVFEAVILLLRPSSSAAPDVLAALLVYRVLYFLLPLALAGALLLVRWTRGFRHRPRRWKTMLDAVSGVAPLILSLTTFLSGALLLVGGAIRTDERRLSWLVRLLPLAVIESSHFFASVVGAGMMILAWGLERRVRRAYQLVRVLFVLGLLLSLLRSLDVQLALLLAGALLILQAADAHFPRMVPLGREPISWGWLFAIGSVMLAVVWLHLVTARGVVSAREVWWKFTLFGDAPAATRAVLGIGVVVVLFALTRFLARGAPGELGSE